MDSSVKVPVALLGLAVVVVGVAVGVATFVRGRRHPRDADASDKHSLEYRGLRLTIAASASILLIVLGLGTALFPLAWPALQTAVAPGGDDPLAPPRRGDEARLAQQAEPESADPAEPVPLAAVTLPESTAVHAGPPAPPSLAGTWSWGAGSAGTIICGALLQQPFPVTGVVSIATTPNDNELLWTDSDEEGTCALRLLKQADSATLAPGQSCASGLAMMIPTALTVRRTGPHRLQVSGAGAISAPQFAALGVPCNYQVSATLLLQR